MDIINRHSFYKKACVLLWFWYYVCVGCLILNSQQNERSFIMPIEKMPLRVHVTGGKTVKETQTQTQTMEFIDIDLGLAIMDRMIACGEIADQMDAAVFYRQKDKPFCPVWSEANAMYATTFTPKKEAL